MPAKPIRVAILGSADSTKDKAPFDDPSWQMWGLAWRFPGTPRMDTAFEMHKRADWGNYVDPALYEGWMQDPKGRDGRPIRLVLRPEDAPAFPKAVPYPLDKARALLGGREYFTSSFSYMLAMAIMEGAEEIGIWGVDLLDETEYAQQRPAAEFLLGIAHAKGIQLTIPPESALLKSGFVYGVDDDGEDPAVAYFQKRVEGYREKIRESELAIAAYQGCVNEAQEAVTALRARKRGLWKGGNHGD